MPEPKHQDESWRGEDGRFDVALWHIWAEKHGLQPWQQTKDAFTGTHAAAKPIGERYGPQGSLTVQAIALCEVERLGLKRIQLEAHKRSVIQALNAGKRVSEAVLADYPELITRSQPSTDVVHQ